ncbi:MAG: hypothetical protein ACOC1M_07435 [Halanaerobium sp.]
MVIIYKKAVILILVLIICSSSSILAADLDIYTGSRNGYASYTINDQSKSWQSVLEFPLDYKIVEFDYKLKFENYIKFADLSYLRNISNQSSDHFIDSDWLRTAGEGKPDIYAEAESRIEMYECSLDFVSNYDLISAEKIFLGIGFGFMESNHEYMILGPGYQRNNLNNSEMIFDQDEKLLEYDLNIKGPNLLLFLEAVNLAGKINIYPNLKVDDLDHHILRGKYSEGNNRGSGLRVDLNFKKDLSSNLSFKAGFIYELIKVKGKQTQWFENSNLEYLVDYKLNYNYNSITAGVEYRF